MRDHKTSGSLVLACLLKLRLRTDKPRKISTHSRSFPWGALESHLSCSQSSERGEPTEGADLET